MTKRQPTGIPIGGQFAASARPEADVAPVGVAHHRLLDERASDIVAAFEEDASAVRRSRNEDGPVGFSLDAVRAIEPYTSSTYWKYGFRTSTFGDGSARHEHNAGTNAQYSGLGGQDAARVRDALPQASIVDSTVDGPPSTKELLDAAAASRGRVEVSGTIFSPDREDEGIRAWGVSIYDDELVAAAEKGGAGAKDDRELLNSAMTSIGIDRGKHVVGDPETLRIVENPWRPGEKALSIEWE